MIKECKREDIPFLVACAYQFNADYFDVDLDEMKIVDYLYNVIDSECGVAFRSDTGAIVGVQIEDPVRDWRVLVETGWYSEGKDGARLLAAFEARGRELGMDEIRLTTLECNPGPAAYLRRKGYTPIETSHRLRL